MPPVRRPRWPCRTAGWAMVVGWRGRWWGGEGGGAGVNGASGLSCARFREKNQSFYSRSTRGAARNRLFVAADGNNAATAGDSHTSRSSNVASSVITAHHASSCASQMPKRQRLPAAVRSIDRSPLLHISSTISHAAPRQIHDQRGQHEQKVYARDMTRSAPARSSSPAERCRPADRFAPPRSACATCTRAPATPRRRASTPSRNTCSTDAHGCGRPIISARPKADCARRTRCRRTDALTDMFAMPRRISCAVEREPQRNDAERRRPRSRGRSPARSRTARTSSTIG